jgi:hypothetical protein
MELVVREAALGSCYCWFLLLKMMYYCTWADAVAVAFSPEERIWTANGVGFDASEMIILGVWVSTTFFGISCDLCSELDARRPVVATFGYLKQQFKVKQHIQEINWLLPY